MEVPDYALPYFDTVGADPGVEDMHKVVCVDGRRPELPQDFSLPTGPPSPSLAALAGVCRAATECWYDSPAARLAAFRVKKTLASLQQAHLLRKAQESDDEDKIV